MKCLMTLIVLFLSQNLQAQNLPEGFVYLKNVIPNIEIDLRYYSSDNFIGDTIDGYHVNKCIIGEKAALALKEVQAELNAQGLGLKVFDAYRPQRAVNHFVRWAKALDDTTMKAVHYPEVDKSRLFEEGYIAARSGHSRGSTLDLTIIYLEGENKGKEMDMGTPWDYFGVESWPSSVLVSDDQIDNRMILQRVMIKHGFKPLREEWWHFTLKDEPFKGQYFDFPVE